MAGRRRAPRNGRLSPLRLVVVAGVLLALVFVTLRFLPGSPFESTIASQWGISAGTGDRSHADQPSSRSDRPSPTPSPSPTLPPLPLHRVEVNLNFKGWWSWSVQDTRTGEIFGSENMAETSTTASLIKAWIAADFLRRSAEQGKTPTDTQMHQVSIMIRDSDNDAAQALWGLIGKSASINRLIKICKLTDSSGYKDLWSNTRLSPRDITRLGACIADGKAAGPKWTDYLLKEMRAVRGVGDFGIRKAFPADERKQIAIKNGWVDRTREQEIHVNCLAIGDGWTMGVMVRYPIELGYDYGMKGCQDITKQVRAPL